MAALPHENVPTIDHNTNDARNDMPNNDMISSEEMYFVNRFLIFSDGFTPFTSKGGSLDGWYIVMYTGNGCYTD